MATQATNNLKPNQQCPRCGGSVLTGTCILCGEEAPTGAPAPSNNTQPWGSALRSGPTLRPTPPVGDTERSAPAATWQDLALQELTTLITHIDQLTAKRKATIQKAIHVRNALQAGGVTDLPHIPGIRDKTKQQAVEDSRESVSKDRTVSTTGAGPMAAGPTHLASQDRASSPSPKSPPSRRQTRLASQLLAERAPRSSPPLAAAPSRAC